MPGGHSPREENSATARCRKIGTRGRRKRAGSTSTSRIWPRARCAAMARSTCQLCAPCKERAVVLTEKTGPRSGESGARRAWDTSLPRQKRTRAQGRERPSSALDLGCRAGLDKGCCLQISHAFSAWLCCGLILLRFLLESEWRQVRQRAAKSVGLPRGQESRPWAHLPNAAASVDLRSPPLP